MTETYKTLQALILKSEGKKYKIGKISSIDVIADPEMKDYEMRWEFPKEDLKDEEIGLERVLMALQKKYFYQIKPNQGFDSAIISLVKSSEEEFICNWTLGQPAHLQSKETLQALINILR